MKASYPPGIAKEDWKIFNLINRKLNNEVLFKNFRDLRIDSLKQIKNHSDFDSLPETNLKQIGSEKGNFFND